MTRRIPAGDGVYNLAVTHDGKYIVTTNKRGKSPRRSSTSLSGQGGGSSADVASRLASGVAVSSFDDRYAFVTQEGVGSEPGAVDVIDLRSLHQGGHDRHWPAGRGIDFWKAAPSLWHDFRRSQYWAPSQIASLQSPLRAAAARALRAADVPRPGALLGGVMRNGADVLLTGLFSWMLGPRGPLVLMALVIGFAVFLIFRDKRGGPVRSSTARGDARRVADPCAAVRAGGRHGDGSSCGPSARWRPAAAW